MLRYTRTRLASISSCVHCQCSFQPSQQGFLPEARRRAQTEHDRQATTLQLAADHFHNHVLPVLDAPYQSREYQTLRLLACMGLVEHTYFGGHTRTWSAALMPFTKSTTALARS